jgi:TH1 protein
VHAPSPNDQTVQDVLNSATTQIDEAAESKSDGKVEDNRDYDQSDKQEEEVDLYDDGEEEYSMAGTPEDYGEDDQFNDDDDDGDLGMTSMEDRQDDDIVMSNDMEIGIFGDEREDRADMDSSDNIESSANNEEIERLISILSKRDAIMEPDVTVNTKRLRSLNNEKPLDTVTRLSETYVGYGPMTNILNEWLICAKIMNEDPLVVKSSNNISIPEQLQHYKSRYESKQKEICQMMLQELSIIIKQKFDRVTADAIILQMSDIPTWLLAMMNNVITRKTLIELYNLHSDSTLLGFVLRQLSKLGFHNEIAHIIREFEYLDVFNDIVVDIMTRVRILY